MPQEQGVARPPLPILAAQPPLHSKRHLSTSPTPVNRPNCLPPPHCSVVTAFSATPTQPPKSPFALERFPAQELVQCGLLQRCQHKCTAHKPGGDAPLDSTVCSCPALRDTVEETLLPEERQQINSIAARVYSLWHPMDHPLQMLVRSRHHRFAGDTVACVRDLRAGLKLLRHGNFANAPGIQQKFDLDFQRVGFVPPSTPLLARKETTAFYEENPEPS